MKKALVLTETFEINDPKKEIFLIGDWCITERNENFFKNFNYNICKSFSEDNSNILENYKKCENIYESLIKDIRLRLNEKLNTNFSERAWKIIIGHWLKRFIYICFDRYHNLKRILEEYKVDEIYSLSTKEYSLATEDTLGIYLGSINDTWNNKIYNLILEHLGFSNINKLACKERQLEYQDSFKIEKKKFEINKSLNFLSSIYSPLQKLLPNQRILFFKTYLPFLEEKKLELKFNSIPTIYRPNNFSFEQINLKLRNELNFFKSNCDDLESFIRKILNKALPISILESFNEILKSAIKKFPKNPKIIFTSNAFDLDEEFKSFVAFQIEKGAKYCVGQHGGSYFTWADGNLRVEAQTSDKFFSWGYTNKKNIVPLFNINSVKKKNHFNSEGTLTVIMRSFGYRATPFNRYMENEIDMNNIKEILNSLNQSIKKKTLIRFHQSHKTRGKILTREILKNKFMKFDFGEINYKKIKNDTRIFFFNYDSTGLLENLATNTPSISYWTTNHERFDKEFQKKYEFLIEANILFKEKKDLIIHLEKNWSDVGKWWFSEKTQNLIAHFNKDFNLKTKNLKHLNILKKEIEKN